MRRIFDQAFVMTLGFWTVGICGRLKTCESPDEVRMSEDGGGRDCTTKAGALGSVDAMVKLRRWNSLYARVDEEIMMFECLNMSE